MIEGRTSVRAYPGQFGRISRFSLRRRLPRARHIVGSPIEAIPDHDPVLDHETWVAPRFERMKSMTSGVYPSQPS